jgi:phosphate uptake regulator
LERISDHACYVGDSITYIVTGSSSQRLQPWKKRKDKPSQANSFNEVLY